MRNILSIDGGGVKTFMPLYLLNEIEKRTKKSTAELFDYFTGVSASALICSMLLIKNEEGTSKYSANDIINIFEKQCKIIFDYTYLGWIKTGFGLFDSTYSSTNIDKSINEYFTDITITNLLKPISIISYDLITNKPIFFNLQNYPNILIKECLLATTAAPTYFAPYETTINDKKYLLIDGGVVSNNPIEQCFLDAYDYFNVNNDLEFKQYNNNFFTLSIGTGFYDVNHCKGNFGKIGWSNKIIDILFNANISEHNYQFKLIDRFIQGNKLERIDFKLSKTINLDNIYSFNEMKLIMDEWIKNNDEKITSICEKLLINISKDNDK
jgi:patatin-like phospholipase/acyl hydrolase